MTRQPFTCKTEADYVFRGVVESVSEAGCLVTFPSSEVAERLGMTEAFLESAQGKPYMVGENLKVHVEYSLQKGFIVSEVIQRLKQRKNAATPHAEPAAQVA